MHAGIMKPSAAIALLAGVLVVVTGCTSREIYQSTVGWRQNECQKVMDVADRAQCMQTASKDYDSYSKQKAGQR